MRGFGEFFVIVNGTVRCRVLHQRTKDCVIEFEMSKVAGDNFDAQRLGAGTHHLDRLRMAIVRDKEFLPLTAGANGVVTESHCFSRCGCLIE